MHLHLTFHLKGFALWHAVQIGQAFGLLPTDFRRVPAREPFLCSTSLPHLLQDHGDTIAALCEEIRPRSRLKPHHRQLFDPNSDDLFHRLGLTACDTGVVSRKEFLETFSAASAIHPSASSRRVADLAAGHGLLSWFLLAMDDDQQSEGHPLTVVCIDRRMPPSAHVIQAAMKEEFPKLGDRWSYIQADLSAMDPHPSCLLASVHACGTLSDFILALAIGHKVPLAIVPCCHTVQEGLYQPHAHCSNTTFKDVAARVQQRKQEQPYAKHQAVADVVDEVRIQTLNNADFEVEAVLLPHEFTGRNRLLIAAPRSNGTVPDATLPIVRTRTKSQLPPLTRIPLADNEESIAHCNSLSVETQTSKEDEDHLVSKYTSLTLAMCLWLPEDVDHGSVQRLQVNLQQHADQCCEALGSSCALACTLYAAGDIQQKSDASRQSQLYKFKYYRGKNKKLRGKSRDLAKKVHSTLKEQLVKKFGYALRT